MRTYVQRLKLHTVAITFIVTVTRSLNKIENVTIGNFRTSDSQNIISLSHKALADTCVPQPVAEGIRKKAEMLVTENNAVVAVPGCGDKDRMVKSKSGSAPPFSLARNFSHAKYNQ